MLERDRGQYLITQRSKTSSLPLLWEFPGGRVQDGETDEAALVRELKERLSIDVLVSAKAAAMKHEYPDYDVDFTVFHCRLKDSKQTVQGKVNDHRWVQLSEMSQYEFPKADAKTLERLLELA